MSYLIWCATMRVIPFLICVVLTTLLAALYISKHNRLTELRIRALSHEKELKLEEAEKRRLELELAIFCSPVRLEEVARKAQYAHLRTPKVDELLTLDEP